MALAAGTRLGPYEILSLLGAGGMGEVYKARDTRLDRIVAVKVSKEKFSERFEREARSIAALNHPHICTLYDVGPDYLVMEYVEGQPLKGPMPVEPAMKYAGQICDALDAAHKKGITHRDLKPVNILVTKSGVKLLDFGLARIGSGAADDTVTMAVMGTPAYMAPEQWEGKPGDARSDIYAFGCVLYEMLTGKRVSMERTPLESAALESIVSTCLRQDPDDRWQSAGDIKRALETVRVQPPQTAPSRSRLGLVPWAIAVVLAIVAGYELWPKPAELKPLLRLDIELEPPPPSTSGTNVIISPDGSLLVWTAGRLFARRLDRQQATEIGGTEGAIAPFFSPDGQWIAFTQSGTLKKISVDGGSPIALGAAAVGPPSGGVWGDDGYILLNITGPFSRVPAAGGKPEIASALDSARGELFHYTPQLLPGGKSVLFTVYDGARTSVVGMSLADRRRNVLVEAGSSPRYFALPNGDGYLTYLNGGTLFAVTFDPKRLEERSRPVAVLEDVVSSGAYGVAHFDASRDGTVVYQRGSGGGASRSAAWVDSTGNAQPLLPKSGSYLRPRFSPDGNRVALEDSGDIWVYQWQRDTKTRLTSDGGQAPIWTPDGRYIVYRSSGGISWTPSDGASLPKPLLRSQTTSYPGSFSPDGKRLAYHELGEGGSDIYTVPIENSGTGLRAGKPEPFFKTAANKLRPAFSPDGHWLAYDSNESGTNQVYVRSIRDNGGKWQVSADGGTNAAWSRDRRSLFFRNLDNQVMVAGYTVKGDTFNPERPRLWAEMRLANVGFNASFDLHPDGERIVALLPAESAGGKKAETHVTILFNFLDELRRRVPAPSK